MKNYRVSKELGEIDEAFIEEVFEYKRRSRSWIKYAAAAACCALAVGICAAAVKTPGLKPAPENDAAVPDIASTAPAEDNAAVTVEVERSYDERIAAGEDVEIETYIDIPYRIWNENYAGYGDFTYTLKSVMISDKFPEGITKADISGGNLAVSFDDGGEEDYIHPEGDDSRWLTVKECIDGDGRYAGPGNGYKWVFLTVDITNNSDEQAVKFLSSLRLVGGEMLDLPISIDGEVVSASYREYEYGEEVCYLSDRYFDYDTFYGMTLGGNISDEKREEIQNSAIERYGSVEAYLREVFYGASLFGAKETKTVTVGFPVNNYYVYGDLALELNPAGLSDKISSVYIPLK